MITFSDPVEIAAAFAQKIQDVNKKCRGNFIMQPDPLTFIGWMACEGLLNDDMCRRKAAEIRLQDSLDKIDFGKL